MNKIFTIILFSILYCITLKAQISKNYTTNSILNQKDTLKKVRHKLIDVELNGPTTYLCGYYDVRFKKQAGGLGWRAGFGNSIFNDRKTSTDADDYKLVAGVNYLFGNEAMGNYFELGLSTNFLLFEQDLNGREYIPSKFYFATNMGFRHQPSKEGLSYRAGIVLSNRTIEQATYFYMSVGFSFTK